MKNSRGAPTHFKAAHGFSLKPNMRSQGLSDSSFEKYNHADSENIFDKSR